MIRKLALVALVVLSIAACGSQEDSQDTASTALAGTLDTFVDVGGHRLHARVIGSGSPTVVIEPGIGESDRVWGGVVAAIAPHHRVVIYDRAGYRQSEAGPMPRTAETVVGELTTLLEKLPVEPPFVLAGHSLGAMHSLVYAVEHPDRVAGLVILDLPPIGFITGERFSNLGELAVRMTAGFYRDADNARAGGNAGAAAFLEAVASEHESMYSGDGDRLKSIESLGDLPMVVIGSGVSNPSFGDSAVAFQEFWRESSEALAGLSSRGRFIFVEESTHNLPGEATQEVIDAIRGVAK